MNKLYTTALIATLLNFTVINHSATAQVPSATFDATQEQLQVLKRLLERTPKTDPRYKKLEESINRLRNLFPFNPQPKPGSGHPNPVPNPAPSDVLL